MVSFQSKLAALSAGLASLYSFGSQVLNVERMGAFVTISTDHSQIWKLSDSVCLYRGHLQVSCGHLIRIEADSALVVIAYHPFLPRVGDSVRRTHILWEDPFKTKFNRESSSFEEKSKLEAPAYQNLTSLGANLLNPTLSFERGLSDHIALGVLVTTLNGTLVGGSQTAYGVLPYLAYYFDHPLEGAFIEGNSGLYVSKLSVNGKSTIIPEASLRAGAGWRWNWKHFSGGFVLGAQYFYMKKNSALDYVHQFFQPVVELDIGIRF